MICQSILSIAVSTLSGNIAGDYKDYFTSETEVVNDIIVTYRMVDDFVYLASWEHGGAEPCVLI